MADSLAAVRRILGLDGRRVRTGIAARMTRTFVLVAGALILLVGLALTWASYGAVLEQVRVRQQKTAREAALVTTAYLTRAQETLNTYGRLGSLQGLLLRSMRIQQEELTQLMIEQAGMFQSLTLVDSSGNELAKVVATGIDPSGSGVVSVAAQDLGSAVDSAAFRRAIAGETYVSDFVAEVRPGLPPAATIAVPLRGRDRDGVLIADLGVDGLWSAMGIVDMGRSGYAYIVSRETGELITAQPASGGGWSTSMLRSPATVAQMVAGGARDGASTKAMQYPGLMGLDVIGAAEELPGTSWELVAELPVDEAMASANRVLYLLALLVVVGAVAAGSLGLMVPRRVVRPILALQEGAKEISAGRLDHEIDINTGDELEELANSFNQMASSLRVSRAELEEWGRDLEIRVADRTSELKTLTNQMQRRADQLQISAEVAHTIASVRDLDALLPQVTKLISERFGWYHVGIFLLEETREASRSPFLSAAGTIGTGGEYVILRAANSEGGQRMLEGGHRLRVTRPGEEGQGGGIVGSVAGSGKPRIALDVGEDAIYFDNPQLPATRSEMALPLKVTDRVIGVLDVQSRTAAAYDDEDVAILGVLADQVAVAIENALLFEQTQEALQEVRALHRRYVEQEWVRSTAAQGELAYEYRRGAGTPVVVDDWPPELRRALTEKKVVVHTAAPPELAGPPVEPDGEHPFDVPLGTPSGNGGGEDEVVPSALAVPIKFRDQVIGVVDLQETDEPRWWTEDEIVLVQAIADQVGLALENARLFSDTQHRAEQLATLHRVGLEVTAALDLDGVLQALYRQISRIMDAESFYVALYDDATGIIDFPLMTGDEGRIEASPRSIHEEPGITGEVLRTGQPLYVADLVRRDAFRGGSQPYRAISIGERRTRSYIGVPLVFREQVFGVLSVQSYMPGAYRQEDVELLTTISTQASIAIQNARAYQQLVETAEQLREIDRLKTQFLANMSHELRTPLNSIIGFSRVMLKGIDGPLTEHQEADLNSIYGSGQHLLGLINSILDMSKIEAGKMDLSFDEVSLHDVFNTAVSTTRALVKDDPIELRTEIPDTLPKVWADAQRVRQVLLNLMSNAAKFTEEGQITLKAEVRPGEASRFVTISVRDTGIGIEKEAQHRLFIPFQQVDASTTRRAGGTGLGLAISRSFVEMMGGNIWVESAPGHGATFFFTLPIYSGVPAGRPTRTLEPVGESEAAGAESPVADEADLAVAEPSQAVDQPEIAHTERVQDPDEPAAAAGSPQPVDEPEAARLESAQTWTEHQLPHSERGTMPEQAQGFGVESTKDLAEPEMREDDALPTSVAAPVSGTAPAEKVTRKSPPAKPEAPVPVYPAGGYSGPPNVVLVVDDDRGVVTLLKRYLETEGYQVVGVVESPEVVDVARRLAPRLAAITLDIVMPRMDGWQVLRALKGDPDTKDVPVILCSIVDGLEHGLTLGADMLLRKPVTRDDVLGAVRKVEAARATVGTAVSSTTGSVGAAGGEDGSQGSGVSSREENPDPARRRGRRSRGSPVERA